MSVRLCLAILILILSVAPGATHESRPAYLDIRELQPGQYEVLWKRPTRGDLALGLSVRWPAACRNAVPGTSHAVPGALIENSLLDCGEQGLVGQRIEIDGLASTRTDTLVRVAFGDGTSQSNLVKPAAAWVDIEGPRPALAVAGDYFLLGVEHILLGLDHLLFVLGLTLIVRSGWLLVQTITAFTVAHSLTLGAATLGFFAVPQAPVEAVIALSIVFLASELARQGRGEPSLTSRHPWIVASTFGLLHGFGFAGALAEIGLPAADIPLALLTFNLGVEAGQLAFVAAVVALLWAGRHMIAAPPRWLGDVPAYAIGSLAVFWLFERLAGFG
jgi:hydrogenase/urease accessory protein HupE